jgi:hypothetical protein
MVTGGGIPHLNISFIVAQKPDILHQRYKDQRERGQRRKEFSHES